MNALQKVAVGVGFFVILGLNLILTLYYYGQIRIGERQKQILTQLQKTNEKPQEFPLSAAPLVLGAVETQIDVTDGRAANLRNFFRTYNSPLYDYADVIVQTADKYKLDYRIIPAIAMQESSGCLKIPPGSYNCWGWGIYGTQVLRFNSYEEAIDTVSAGIKKSYVDQGLITPHDVMAKYTPSSNGSWADAITYFFQTLE